MRSLERQKLDDIALDKWRERESVLTLDEWARRAPRPPDHELDERVRTKNRERDAPLKKLVLL